MQPDNWNELMKIDDYIKKPCESDSISEFASSERESSSNINSDFRFSGDYRDPYQVLKKSPDFDSIIVLLNEVVPIR